MVLLVQSVRCQEVSYATDEYFFSLHPNDIDMKDIYRWLVHLLIYSDKDPAHKLMNFLLENGVNDNDLEYGMYRIEERRVRNTYVH